MGSGPGVAGASGMQVQPLLPLRSTVIAPFASICTIVAFEEMDAGAADSALAMGSVVCATTALPARTPAAAATSGKRTFENVMEPSFASRGRTGHLPQQRLLRTRNRP